MRFVHDEREGRCLVREGSLERGRRVEGVVVVSDDAVSPPRHVPRQFERAEPILTGRFADRGWKDELGADFEGLLETADANEDAVIDRDEWAAGRKSAEEEMRENRRQGIGGGILERLDKDGDGKISKEEAPDRMKQNFDTLDKNGDGFITVLDAQRALQFSTGLAVTLAAIAVLLVLLGLAARRAAASPLQNATR